MKFGTEEQKQKYLPRMATGEIRAAFSLSEPELGSDVAAIKTTAKKASDGDMYEINGTKMWVTNGLRAGLVFTLVRTDPNAEPKHRGMTCFIAEKEPGVSENTGAVQGLQRPAAAQEDGLQGRRVDRARVRRLHDAGRQHPRWRGGRAQQGLRADDGRARAGPRQRRRARRRARAAGARARAPVLARSGRPSASRSPSTRRSSSSSPTWPPRSRRRGC